MTDISSIHVWDLIGKLYNESEKAADNDKELFMDNPDALSFADAFCEALDNAKHGNKIILPLHLHKKVSQHHRKYLCVPESIES